MPKANASLAQDVPLGKKNRAKKGDAYIRPSKSKGFEFEGVIPRTDFDDLTIFYAHSEKDARSMVLEELARREGIIGKVKPSRDDNQDFYRMLVLRQENGLTDRLIEIFKRGIAGLGNSKIGWGRFLVTAFSKVRDAKRLNPDRRKNTQKENMRPSLRRSIQWFGWTTPAIEVIQDPKKLEKAVREKLIKETPGGPAFSTRVKDRMNLKRLTGIGCEIYGLPEPKSWVFDGEPEGVRPPTDAPKPEVMRKFKMGLLAKRPEVRLFALKQTDQALRPEEAYRALQNPMSFVADDRYNYPQIFAKTGVTCDRTSRIRPATWAWWATIPGLLDGTRTDFRLIEDGKFVPCHIMQRELYALLKDCGYVPPPGGIPDECFRKAMLSASIACCDGPEQHPLVAYEASHSVLKTLYKHYDARWTRAMGIAYWTIFPGAIPEGLSDYDLYHAWGQPPPSSTRSPNIMQNTTQSRCRNSCHPATVNGEFHPAKKQVRADGKQRDPHHIIDARGCRQKVGVGRFVVAAYSRIPEGYGRTPGQTGSSHKNHMRSAMRQLVQRWGWKTPLMDLIAGSKKDEFKEWVTAQFINESSGRAFTTRRKHLQNIRRLLKIGFEVHGFGQLPSFLRTATRRGVRIPTSLHNL